MTGCQVRLVMSTDAAFQRAFARVYGEDPGVGLARQHERLEQTHAVLTREYENAARALGELRQSHEDFLREQADLLRSAAEQASQQGVHKRRLAEARRHTRRSARSTRRAGRRTPSRPGRKRRLSRT